MALFKEFQALVISKFGKELQKININVKIDLYID